MHQIEFIRGFKSLRSAHSGCVATVGAFDGVHKGHQQLLRRLVKVAKQVGLPSTVVLFEPQPNEYFSPDCAPARLMRLREKVNAIAQYGVDRVLCLKFDASLRGLTAESFVDQVLVKGLGLRSLIVGDDFHFGCDRKGDFAFLVEAGQRFGFDVSDTKTHLDNDVRVSSTYIRGLLQEAKLEKAKHLLGRAYSNLGRVVYGRQLGRELGFPTMNVHLGRLKVPLSGVFAVRVLHKGTQYDGVANVGVRPTVNNLEKPILEVHVLNAQLDAYGDFIQVFYEEKIREEMRFSSLEKLTEQITMDVAQARKVFQAAS